ncbi:50S ribosomal protein L21 [Bradyrhizobium sp. F1.13.3]|uniref:50S ribosomal protein L21 n=1 Tax=Bradyrhizobium sp. F1.13.3 TaxID=3156351 RepID=UPI0033983F84
MPQQPPAREKWAIFKTGGKQYRVGIGDVVNVSSEFTRAIPANADGRRLFTFDEVLAVKADAELVLGQPIVHGAKVVGELLDDARMRKVTTLKKRRRKNSRRKRGHRQDYHPVRIVEIAPQTRGAFDSVSAASAGAAPIPVSATTEPHADLVETLDALRSGSGVQMDKPLRRLVATDWTERPSWERMAAASAAERVFTAQDGDLRSLAALAIYRATAASGATDETPQAIADGVSGYFERRGRPFFLEIELGRTDAKAEKKKYNARIRLRRWMAEALPGVVHGSPAEELSRLDPRIRLSGYGLVSKTKKFSWRRDLPSGLVLDGVVEFENDDNASKTATLDVVLGGRRVDRRFLRLDSLTVTREEPPASGLVRAKVQESAA